MFRIKRLYIYILQSFVPVFFMTFTICLFIILMQFVWKYVEDFVGKGLDVSVIVELFTYAALTLVPMALPLAILLASLMTFGNLGERYELLSIKAAGISLLRAMRPLIILVAFICLIAFFFQNNVIPKVQVKFKTLMFSIRQKSPELDIPENTFYSGIDNYNLYIQSKDKETGMMYGLMIYDISKGFENMAVIVCDSGNLRMSSNKDYLLLNLYNGQQFSNFQQSGISKRQHSGGDQFIPYMRENFKLRKLIMPFDANFNRIDESSMDGNQISKNILELRETIDSLETVIDSMNVYDRKIMLDKTLFSYQDTTTIAADTSLSKTNMAQSEFYDIDSLLNSYSLQEKEYLFSEAMSRIENNKNDVIFRSIAKLDTETRLRQHDVELQGKFSLSFACLVFFFIGAPLGAIIRKGGLGTPVVISVAMFIFYYIINNIGYKMARDGVWDVWQGVWLSSFVLFPLGVFITYKAINDSALFNPEAYSKYLRKLFFIKKLNRMSEDSYNAIVSKIPPLSDLSLDPVLEKTYEVMDSDNLRSILENNKEQTEIKLAALTILKDRGADINSFIERQDVEYTKANLNQFIKNSLLAIIAYIVFIVTFYFDSSLSWLNITFGIAYVVLFLRSFVYYFSFYGKVNTKTRLTNIIIAIISLFLYPITFGFVRRRMTKYIKKVQIIF